MFIKVGASWYEINPKGWYTEDEDSEKKTIARLGAKFVAAALAMANRKDPIHRGVSAKSIGSRYATSTDKNILSAYHHALKPGADALAYNKAKSAWATMKASTGKTFQEYVSAFQAKQITKNQFIIRTQKLFKAAYERAYRLGTDASGLSFMALPIEDIKWLARARSKEYTFLHKFADDIEHSRGTMAYNDRASMYVDTMDSIFDAGRVDGYPNESTKIWWELGAAEHCGDCIELAMFSPYFPDTLPTTPKAGDTACLANCQCSLRIRYDVPDRIEFDIRPVSQSMARELGLLGIGLYAVNKISNKDVSTAMEPADPELEDWDDFGDVLDWNVLDDMLSSLLELRIAKDSKLNARKKQHLKEHALDRFESTQTRLPDWIDPFSPDTFLLHELGACVLHYMHKR